MKLNDILKSYKKVFETDDDGSIALIAAILVGSKLKTAPVWLYLIGPSSGGKSALIEAFAKVEFITQVSDLTANTFLSGMSNRSKETSLLLKLGNNFVITMKDFTTILSKSAETQEAIISQMREIYDGFITKETGTGESLKWGGDPKKGEEKGHATFIMASTEGIYTVQEKFADMGTRAINYVMLPQDRKKVCKRALQNNISLEDDIVEIQNIFRDFIEEKLGELPAQLPYITDELEDRIIEIADFSSACRSVIQRDYRGVKSLALSTEMPMRMAKQLLSVAQLLTFINDGNLSKELEQVVYKIGLDSIPKQRRLALEILARYELVSVSGMASKINYPDERCREWIEDLNMFHICFPVKDGMRKFWKIKPEYRKVMTEYGGVTYEKNETLDGTGDDTIYETPSHDYDVSYLNPHDVTYDHKEEMEESEKQAQDEFDNYETS